MRIPASFARLLAVLLLALPSGALFGSGCGGDDKPRNRGKDGAGGGGEDAGDASGGAGGFAGFGATGGGGQQECSPGETRSCYEGPPGSEGVGECVAGEQTCTVDGLSWGFCSNQVTPQAETCESPGDEDCDGVANEEGPGCTCLPGDSMDCYTGPVDTKDVGLCQGGTQTCLPEGTGYGPCNGEVVPTDELCVTPGDDDCDGMTNEEGIDCVCTPNETAPCYTGPPLSEGVGPCVGGTWTCDALGTAWGPCIGEVTPQPEACGTPIDDDCDGAINEEGADCVCSPNATTACYTGPPGTEGTGPCQGGLATCDDQGLSLGPCEGEVTPQVETCNTPIDDDCDGMINEDGAGCACQPNSSVPCYSGPPGTSGVGACTPGTQTCNDQGTFYGPCQGEVTPVPEDCNTTEDDNCDGTINEGCP